MTRFSYGPGPEHALPPSGNFAESVETYYGCQRAKAKYSLLVKLEMPGLNVAIHDAESVGVSYCPLVDPSSASGLNRLTTLTPQQHLASRNTDDSDGHFRVQSSQLLPEVHRPNSFLETLKRSLSSAPCPIFVFDVEVFLNETLHVSHSPTLRIEINPLLQHESNTCTTIPKIELLSLTFEIKGTTAVWAQNQGASAEKTYYTITEASKPPLTFDARDGYSITWDCTPLAGGLLPSFRTYNIARSYAAHVDVVLSCAGKLVAVSHQRGVVVDVPRREGRARGGEVDLLTGSPRGFEYTDEGSDGGQLPAYSGRHMTRLLEESPSSSTQTTAASDERTSASGKN